MNALSKKEKEIIKFIGSNPYCERKKVIEKFEEKISDLDKILEKLVKDMIILELTSQPESSLESRVPKKIYLLNPEKGK